MSQRRIAYKQKNKICLAYVNGHIKQTSLRCMCAIREYENILTLLHLFLFSYSYILLYTSKMGGCLDTMLYPAYKVSGNLNNS